MTLSAGVSLPGVSIRVSELSQKLLAVLREDVGLTGQEANLSHPTRDRDSPFRAEVWPGLKLLPDLWRGHACGKPGEQESLTSPSPSSTSFRKHPSGFLEPSLGLAYTCPPLTKTQVHLGLLHSSSSAQCQLVSVIRQVLSKMCAVFPVSTVPCPSDKQGNPSHTAPSRWSLRWVTEVRVSGRGCWDNSYS